MSEQYAALGYGQGIAAQQSFAAQQAAGACGGLAQALQRGQLIGRAFESGNPMSLRDEMQFAVNDHLKDWDK